LNKSFYWKWHVEIGLVVVAVFLMLGGFALWSTRSTVEQQSERGAQAYRAVCTLRHDLRVREAQGEAFLKAHPDGAFGIPAAVLRASIENQQHTIFALRELEC
jgi:hypothetical protein